MNGSLHGARDSNNLLKETKLRNYEKTGKKPGIKQHQIFINFSKKSVLEVFGEDIKKIIIQLVTRDILLFFRIANVWYEGVLLMKKIRLLGNITFILTLISPIFSFAIASIVGESEIFRATEIVRYSWIMYIFIPIGLFFLTFVFLQKKRT